MLDNRVMLSVAAQGQRPFGIEYELRRSLTRSFWRAYSIGRLHRLWLKLTGRSAELKHLDLEVSHQRIVSRHAVGEKTVLITMIQGSEDRCDDYDAQFRPRKRYLIEGWLGIAIARSLNLPLPPVDLIEFNGVYYVRDGHKRISVAHTFGQLTVDALVTVWEVNDESGLK